YAARPPRLHCHPFPTRRSSDLDRDALSLAAGERDSALPDHRVVALGEPLDELVRLRGPRGRLDLGVREVAAAERDVVADRAGARDRKSTRLNSSHEWISYAVFC